MKNSFFLTSLLLLVFTNFCILSARAELEDLVSQNIVGYVSYFQRTNTVALNLKNVASLDAGVRLGEIKTEGGVPGTNLCFFDGTDWVHVEQLLCDGQLHWCQWIDDDKAIIADDLVVPHNGKLSYALASGVSNIIVAGEVPVEFLTQEKLEFVDDEIYANIRNALADLATYRSVEVRMVSAEKTTTVTHKEPVTTDESVTTNVMIVTNYITKVVTNYVSELKNRFNVKDKTGKTIKASFSLRLCKACDVITGFPLDIDIRKVIFEPDLSVDDRYRSDDLLCQRFYQIQLNQISSGIALDKEAQCEVVEKVKDWSFGKFMDLGFDFFMSRCLPLLLGLVILPCLSLIKLFWAWIKKIFLKKNKDKETH